MVLLKSFSLFYTKFSYPWKGVEASIFPALLAGCLIEAADVEFEPSFLGRAVFLNKHKTVGEKCQSFTVLMLQVGPHYSKMLDHAEMHINMFGDLYSILFLGIGSLTFSRLTFILWKMGIAVPALQM